MNERDALTEEVKAVLDAVTRWCDARRMVDALMLQEFKANYRDELVDTKKKLRVARRERSSAGDALQEAWRKWSLIVRPILTDEAKAKLSEDVKDCYVCGGTHPKSGIPCICDNTGKAHVGMANLLKVHHELVEELNKAKATLTAVDEAMKRCNDCLWVKECDAGGYVPEEGRICDDALQLIRLARKGEKS